MEDPKPLPTPPSPQSSESKLKKAEEDVLNLIEDAALWPLEHK